MNAMLRALWAYRGFIVGSVKREFQSKYRNSLFGAAWTIINPLAMITVYTLIFAEVMRAKLPGVDNTFGYSIFLCAGSLTWGLFSEIVGRGQSVFIDNGNIIKKLSFPRLCLPVVIVLSALLNFSIIFGIFSVFLVFSGNFPGIVFISIVPLLFILIGFSIGLGIALGVMNVFFRDVGQFFGIFLTFWFWLTPIVYAPQALSPSLQKYLAWNPMAPLMRAFQGVLVSGTWPAWVTLFPIFLMGVVFCVLGMWLFRRHAGEMVDEL